MHSCTFPSCLRTWTVWQYRPVPTLSGLLPPHLRPQAQAAPSFNEPLRRPAGRVLSSPLGQNSASWRTIGFHYWAVASITTSLTPVAANQSASSSTPVVNVTNVRNTERRFYR